MRTEILPDIAHRCDGQGSRAQDAGEIALDERHAGALHRNVGAASHRDADVGGGQRRSIVDAVARHGDDAAGAAQVFDDGAFALRQDFGFDIGDAKSLCDGKRGCLAVAGQHDDGDVLRFQRFQCGGCRRFHRIGDGEEAGELVIGADKDNRRTVGSMTLGLGVQRIGRDAGLTEKFGVADRDALRPDCAGALLCRTAPKSETGCGPEIGFFRRVTIAAASGCSLPRSMPAASCRSVFSSKPGAGTTAVTRGLPSVRVPVLSTTRVSIFSMRSSTSAFLIRMPDCAARPTPTMIDIGVASPSAQGQAMISTVTAATSALEKRGSGPKTSQAMNAASATAITAGTNQRGDAVSEPRNGRARALRRRDHADDASQHGVAADFFRAHDESPL